MLKIKIHKRKNRLCLRVSKTHIVFKTFRSIGSQHDSKENESTVIKSFGHNAIQCRLQNVLHKLLLKVVRKIINRSNCAHSTGIGSLRTILKTLVVARGNKRHNT